MAVMKLNNSRLGNIGFTTQKIGATTYDTFVTPSGQGNFPFGYITSVSGENTQQEPERGQWLGVSTGINTTGTLIFDDEVVGGSLSDFYVINGGPQIAYVVINSETLTTANGFPLASGASMTVNNQVNNVGIITSTGIASIQARGTVAFLPNTI